MKLARRLIWPTGIALLALLFVFGAWAFRRSQADVAKAQVCQGMTYDEASAAIGRDGEYFHVVSDLQGYFWKFEDKSILTMYMGHNCKATSSATNTASSFWLVEWVLRVVGL